MDAIGAQMLRKRIAERQWSLAAAVQDGRQPGRDPDADALELVDGGLRIYRAETVSKVVGGRPTTVRRHLTKELMDGAWKSSFVVEQAEPVDEPAA